MIANARCATDAGGSPHTHLRRGIAQSNACILRGGRRLAGALAVFAAVAAIDCRSSQAHPHIWIRAALDVLYDEEGAVTGLRHIWTFDETFTAYSIYGLKKGDGAALDALASRYVKSLANAGYFIEISVAAALPEFTPVSATASVGTDGLLRLKILLPFKTPLRAGAMTLQVYDRDYFVDLSFQDAQSVRLIGAPATCGASLEGPKERKLVDESFFDSLRDSENWARQFATRIRIDCPQAANLAVC